MTARLGTAVMLDSADASPRAYPEPVQHEAVALD